MARDWPAASSTEQALLVKHVSVNSVLDATGVQCGVEVSMSDSDHILTVEHVVLYLSTSGHEARGDLEITLTSPSGTRSVMAPARSEDGSAWSNNDGNYENWKFTTVKNWGETAAGTWTVHVQDKKINEASGSLASWTLAVYGSCDSSANSCTQLFYAHSSMKCNDNCAVSNNGNCEDGGAGTSYAYNYYSGHSCVF
eukprot:3917584-Amphidinium_carterae.1